MKGIVYGVRNLETRKIEKVGSTVRPLIKRAAGYRRHEWFRNGKYELIVLRVVEYDDEKFFQIYLKAVENCEIARQHTWEEEGGRNRIAPLIQWIGSPMLESEKGRIGGRIGIRKMTKETQSRAGKIGGKVSGRHASESGQIQQAGILGRKKNIATGQPAQLGKRNVKSGHLAKLRTVEHQKSAGRKGGVRGGPAANHLRWHVKRGIVNSNCALCNGGRAAHFEATVTIK
jgi:hypothetical protein